MMIKLPIKCAELSGFRALKNKVNLSDWFKRHGWNKWVKKSIPYRYYKSTSGKLMNLLLILQKLFCLPRKEVYQLESKCFIQISYQAELIHEAETKQFIRFHPYSEQRRLKLKYARIICNFYTQFPKAGSNTQIRYCNRRERSALLGLAPSPSKTFVAADDRGRRKRFLE